MATTMLPQYSCDLGYSVSEAMRVAMFGNQELISHYVKLACVSALTTLVRDVGPKAYTPGDWGLLNEHLERSRRHLASLEEEVSKLWESCAEPPF